MGRAWQNPHRTQGPPRIWLASGPAHSIRFFGFIDTYMIILCFSTSTWSPALKSPTNWLMQDDCKGHFSLFLWLFQVLLHIWFLSEFWVCRSLLHAVELGILSSKSNNWKNVIAKSIPPSSIFKIWWVYVVWFHSFWQLLLDKIASKVNTRPTISKSNAK